MSNILFKGIDVSSHNGVIDWHKVKYDSIDFAIIRAGYGTNTVDRLFYSNIDNALNADIKVGIYWFGYAYTVEQAKSEAQFLIKTIEKYKGKISFPIFYDWEYSSYDYAVKFGVKPDKKLVSDITRAFCDELSSNGWFSAVYSNVDYLNRFFDDDIKQKYDIWVAQWNSACTYTGTFTMWQYGAETNKIESKYVDGVNGVVDKDYCYVDYPEIIKSLSMNGYTKVLKGDVNGDGKVDTLDALEILQSVVE